MSLEYAKNKKKTVQSKVPFGNARVLLRNYIIAFLVVYDKDFKNITLVANTSRFVLFRFAFD